jgi:hypothetical protein
MCLNFSRGVYEYEDVESVALDLEWLHSMSDHPANFFGREANAWDAHFRPVWLVIEWSQVVECRLLAEAPEPQLGQFLQEYARSRRRGMQLAAESGLMAHRLPVAEPPC